MSAIKNNHPTGTSVAQGPEQVLRRLGSQFQVHGRQLDSIEDVPTETAGGPLRVVRGDETVESEDSWVNHPTPQLAEIARHLKERGIRILEREESLRAKTREDHVVAQRREESIRTREHELDQREAKLRQLHQSLVQLQSDVIDSHKALINVADTFRKTQSADPGSPAIELLRFEMCARFDHNARHWQRLADQLNPQSETRRSA